MANVFQTFINAWSQDIAYGWSIMDIAGLLIALLVAERLINYFFFKASS